VPLGAVVVITLEQRTVGTIVWREMTEWKDASGNWRELRGWIAERNSAGTVIYLSPAP